MTGRRNNRVPVAIAALALIASSMAIAGPDYEEPPGGDAGNKLDTAEETKGQGSFNGILGKLDGQGARTAAGPGGAAPDFEDLYLIRVVSPAIFSISTVNPLTQFDTSLFLFRQDGTAMLANLDATGGPVGGATIGPDATDATGASITPGIYYLGIAGSIDRPFSGPVPGVGPMFTFASPTEISGPDGPGASLPLAEWGPPGAVGSYFISLSGCAFFRGCEGDANGDGTVDTDDIAYIIFRLGSTVEPGADVDGDGTVTVSDISFVIFRLRMCL